MKELTPLTTHDVYIFCRDIPGEFSPRGYIRVYISSIRNSPGERTHPRDYTQRVYILASVATHGEFIFRKGIVLERNLTPVTAHNVYTYSI